MDAMTVCSPPASPGRMTAACCKGPIPWMQLASQVALDTSKGINDVESWALGKDWALG